MEPIHPSELTTFCQALPKIDLHRHLEGSLRFDTVRQLARAQEMGLPPTGQLRPMVEVDQNQPYTVNNFLSKFSTLRLFYRSQDIISRITQESVSDAAADNIKYLELRFTPAALSQLQGYSLTQVMDWVIEGAQQAQKEYGITTRLIASINRHEDPSLAAQVMTLACERQEDGIVGLDLAGNEADFSAQPFTEIFKEAKENGLHITIHAGEWNTADNIIQAIDEFGAERIGHGIRVLESPLAVALARRQGIVFEVCLTSNQHSGAVKSLEEHPFMRMLEAGLKISLNTDDPSISQISLSDEYELALGNLGLPYSGLRQCILNSANAAFLNHDEKLKLVKSLEETLPQQLVSP
ncbi:MAG: adenosine deaminase [Anaerolineales bacterium]|nr:adenosine deaminase [Anaerolineales bacterium]